MNSYNRPKTKPAQILLVSLLVLMIIAIIVVGVVGVASRDVAQTSGNKQYQKVYNAAESTIYKVIDKYGDSSVSLGNLAGELFTDFGFVTAKCTATGVNVYTCEYEDTDGLATQMIVSDSPTFKDFELTKDSSLELSLNGFRGNLTFSWTGSTAIEFGLIYNVPNANVTLNNLSGYIGDLYDTAGIFSASGAVPVGSSSTHAFPFVRNADGTITFKVGDILGLPATASPLTLRLTARMASTQNQSLLTLSKADNNLPNQVRVFTATSYDTKSDTQTTATVSTQIPLLPQAPAPLNYSLLTKDVVDKSTAAAPLTSGTLAFSCTPGASSAGYCTGNMMVSGLSGTTSSYQFSCCQGTLGNSPVVRNSCVDVAYSNGNEAHCPTGTYAIGAAMTGGNPSTIRCCNFFAGKSNLADSGSTSTVTYISPGPNSCGSGSVATGFGDKIIPDLKVDQIFCTPVSN